MLDLEVVPQQGLQAEQWEFLLGMHFSNAVAIIQSQIGVVRSANVVYNDKTPLEQDLILDLPLDGFRLIFDSKSQRLKIIEVYNMKSVRLKYCSTPFNGPGVSPSVEQIDRCFGATRPGSYDKNRQLFALNFRGLIFYFPVDLQYQPHYSHGLGSLRFPGDASPILSKMIIYNGQNPSDAPPPPLPHAFFRGQVYAEEVIVLRTPSANRTLGLRLKLSSLTTKNVMDPLKVQVEREILFGDGVQSVVTKLGTPARIFFKSDDKMKIHSKEAHKKLNCTKSDYFFNYLTLGLDILFDAGTHTASKFILHTNFPGHYDFNSYHRCPFTLEIGRRTSPTATSVSSPIIHPSLSLKMNNSVQQPHKITNNMAKLNPKPSKAKKNKNNNNQNNINNNNQQNNHNNINNNNNTNTCANNGIGNGLGIGLEEEALVEAGGGDGAVDGGIGLGLGHTVGGGGGGSVNKSPSSILLGSDDPSDMSSCGGKMNGCASTISISFDSHWEEVSDFACENQDKVERPVVLTRSSSNNPFGSSLCYGVQDMIFEVMSNDHIASVTLYQNPHV